jgi:subtilisin
MMAATPTDATVVDTGSLYEELAAVGYAKVIVALKPPVAAAARRTAATWLQDCFMIPSQEQAACLALSARHASRRASRPPTASRRVRVFPSLALAIGYVDRSGLASLEHNPQVTRVVKAAEPSLIRPVTRRTASPGRSTSWGLKLLKVERLWSAGYSGKGVVVGHLDTGVDAAHPALRGAISAFAEFDMAADQVPGAAPWDSGTHGTHTAGTIVGRAGVKGAFGVAPEARLASAMVIEGGQVIDRILGGMEWLVGRNVRIMSMSAGLRGYTNAFQTIIDALRAADVLPVIAIGNEGPNTSRSPGNYANVLSVGAIDESATVADFSGSQRFLRADNPNVPSLVAPGVRILSCSPGGQYAYADGTSMAAPHIAGLAALLLQAKADATAAELETAILESCSRPSGMSEARGNRGVPDAVKAFEILTGTALPGPAAVTVKRTAKRRPHLKARWERPKRKLPRTKAQTRRKRHPR